MLVIWLVLRSIGAAAGAWLYSCRAASALTNLSSHAQNIVTIASAGAIPSLVQLLRAGSTLAVLQKDTAGTLANLAQHAEHAVSIITAGAIPLLVLGSGYTTTQDWPQIEH
jgi:hypothetical protein